MHPKARKPKRQQTCLALICFSLLCMPFYISCGSDSQERKTTSGAPATTGNSGTTGGSTGETPDTGGGTTPTPSTGGSTETYTFKLGAVSTKRGSINFIVSDGKLVANFDKGWKSEDFTNYKLTLITSDGVKFEKISDCSEDTDQVKNTAIYFTEVNSIVSGTIETFTIESNSCP